MSLLDEIIKYRCICEMANDGYMIVDIIRNSTVAYTTCDTSANPRLQMDRDNASIFMDKDEANKMRRAVVKKYNSDNVLVVSAADDVQKILSDHSKNPQSFGSFLKRNANEIAGLAVKPFVKNSFSPVDLSKK
jgi:AAA+ superfamily predicted ATPase